MKTMFSVKYIKFNSLSVLTIFMTITFNAYCQDNYVGLSMDVQNTKLIDFSELNLNTQGAYRPSMTIKYEYVFKNKNAFQTGFGYNMITQKSDLFKNNFYYLSVPLHYKTNVTKESGNITFSTLLGLNFHYLVAANHVFSDGQKLNLKNYSSKFHYEGIIGCGVNKKLTEKIRFESLFTLAIGSSVNRINPSKIYLQNLNVGFDLSLYYLLSRKK
ncbi:MAG: hypothetical protein V1779_13920 [bacterium]